MKTLIVWLHGHGLRYGLGGYWQAAAVSLESGDQVQVRTIAVRGNKITPYYWETNTLWYDPAHYYANFVLASTTGNGVSPPRTRRSSAGRPVPTASAAWRS